MKKLIFFETPYCIVCLWKWNYEKILIWGCILSFLWILASCWKIICRPRLLWDIATLNLRIPNGSDIVTASQSDILCTDVECLPRRSSRILVRGFIDFTRWYRACKSKANAFEPPQEQDLLVFGTRALVAARRNPGSSSWTLKTVLYDTGIAVGARLQHQSTL